MIDLADAIKDIIILYEKACKLEYVKFPLGYALYHNWKKYQHIWEIAEEQMKEQNNIGHNCLSDDYDLGRADAIEEFVKKCDEHAKYDIKKHPQNAYCIDRLTLIKIADELKEQNR